MVKIRDDAIWFDRNEPVTSATESLNVPLLPVWVPHANPATDCMSDHDTPVEAPLMNTPPWDSGLSVPLYWREYRRDGR